jgi:hypothetical protein
MNAEAKIGLLRRFACGAQQLALREFANFGEAEIAEFDWPVVKAQDLEELATHLLPLLLGRSPNESEVKAINAEGLHHAFTEEDGAWEQAKHELAQRGSLLQTLPTYLL